jgi:hypothetical protein
MSSFSNSSSSLPASLLSELSAIRSDPPAIQEALSLLQRWQAELPPSPDTGMDPATAALIASLSGGGGGFQVTPLASSPSASLVDQSPLPAPLAASLLSAPCAACGSKAENWLCLHTRRVLCSRYVQGHAAAHAASSPSKLQLSLSDLSVWDHGQDAYLDVLAIPELRGSFRAVYVAKFGEEPELPTIELEMGRGGDDDNDGGGKPSAKPGKTG